MGSCLHFLVISNSKNCLAGMSISAVYPPLQDIFSSKEYILCEIMNVVSPFKITVIPVELTSRRKDIDEVLTNYFFSSYLQNEQVIRIRRFFFLNLLSYMFRFKPVESLWLLKEENIWSEDKS